MKKYYIADEYGNGLSYIQGALFWHKPNNWETVTNFTLFDTKEQAGDFIFARNIETPKGCFPYINKLILKVKV
jgi:hypothetical protein